VAKVNVAHLSNVSFEVKSESIDEGDGPHLWRHAVAAGSYRRSGHRLNSDVFS
jgi:hypothetical protein